ncbi:uncharacterized protein KY384_000017 [Bacidia gigantensis]|uniref:uncharacterized protein n=1 Tax=Bacidia gigantensis TaxID=2732470 RepID=UPI001D038298|nr:uncharacterized protein KY384_000017 [Bacidia gigantensis]KAG8526424.1 hypothetical protein KY384_000017 [Bacidia gigantensis]
MLKLVKVAEKRCLADERRWGEKWWGSFHLLDSGYESNDGLLRHADAAAEIKNEETASRNTAREQFWRHNRAALLPHGERFEIPAEVGDAADDEEASRAVAGE